MLIGLVYDLRSDYLAEGCAPEQAAEFDSEETIAALADAIRALGHRTDRVGHARALCARLLRGDRWDLVFNLSEGLHGRGREALAPCLLEAWRIPYTFADPLTCAAALDKACAKRLVRSAGLPTPDFRVIADLGELANVRLAYPLFAKPLAEGTGKGIDERSRVETPEQLRAVCRQLLERFGQPVLVEEFLPGREFTVGILGTGPDARVLGITEIAIREHLGTTIYSYRMKETCEHAVRYSPFRDQPLAGEVGELALAAYRALECRDAGRVDIRCDARGGGSFLEVNPLAGLHPTHSDLPMIATQEGMSYRQLIGEIIASAGKRCGIAT